MATLCKSVEKPQDFGIFQKNSSGKAIKIIEKPETDAYGTLANIGVHKLHSSIFPILESLPLSVRGELEITDLINVYIEKGEYHVVEASGQWITIGYPWDIFKAQDNIIGKYTKTENK